MYIGSLQGFSNREDWELDIALEDETGAAIDTTGCTLVISVRDDNNVEVLAGKTGAEITIPETGTARIRFPASQVRALCAGTYAVGLTITDGTNTAQLFVCTVQCIDGIVP